MAHQKPKDKDPLDRLLFWRRLRPRPDASMTEAEARMAGVIPPDGWKRPAYAFPERAMSTFAWGRLAAFVARSRRRNDSGSSAPGLERSRAFCRGALEALDIDLKVSGTSRLPPTETGILFMWNQTSHLDHLILGAVVDRPVRSLYNVELAKVPVYGPWLRKQGHYLVDRYNEEQWRESISRAATDVREKGVSILISPEGTRSWDGRLLPMKRGAFILAIESGAPIVPIIIRGAHRALPRTSGIIRPGTIEVEFGPLVDPRPFTQETRSRLKAQVAEILRRGEP
ncbi:MAG: 1-acyl-sn-glycerol-3-phosphate acyltransferase [Deltaproteobacteria bacterium]|nr:1-acyl-sn-glycerol-3-phosphate acyltransferase [Deltaproteobacteria bacterium]